MSAVLSPPHPSTSSSLVEHVREAYSVGGVELNMDLGGTRNLTLLVTTGSGMLVVRAYGPGVALERLLAIQSVRRALSARGVPTSVPLSTRTGQSWSRYGGRLVEVEEFVEHSARLDSWDRLERALPMLADLHNVLRTSSMSPASKRPVAVRYPNAGEVREWIPRVWKRLEPWPLPPEVVGFVRRAEALAHRVHELALPYRGRVPVQLVHGNFWDSSVLFRAGRVVLVGDFDFMAERPRIDDLALTLYFASSTLAVNPATEKSRRRLRTFVDVYDARLDDHLTTTERRALPLAIAQIPLVVLQYIAESRRAEEVHRLVERMLPELSWSAAIVDQLEHWQEGLA